MRKLTPMLAALLGLLVLAGSSGATQRVGIGRMAVTPTRVIAGSSGNELAFVYTADTAPLSGQMLVDVPRGWTLPQSGNPAGPGYVEMQPAGCISARIMRIVGRRIVIAAKCARRRAYRLLFHRVTAALVAADGYVFLTQTRPAGRSKKLTFRPLAQHKQPVVKVRGAPASGLFMTVTSVATAGSPFSATVRAVDPFGNNAGDYTGTVTLTSTDAKATLPAPFAYGLADAAQHTFTGVIFRTPGEQRLTAADSHGFKIESGPITVAPFSG